MRRRMMMQGKTILEGIAGFRCVGVSKTNGVWQSGIQYRLGQDMRINTDMKLARNENRIIFFNIYGYVEYVEVRTNGIYGMYTYNYSPLTHCDYERHNYTWNIPTMRSPLYLYIDNLRLSISSKAVNEGEVNIRFYLNSEYYDPTINGVHFTPQMRSGVCGYMNDNTGAFLPIRECKVEPIFADQS